jgi:Prp31 C terminal domain
MCWNLADWECPTHLNFFTAIPSLMALTPPAISTRAAAGACARAHSPTHTHNTTMHPPPCDCGTQGRDFGMLGKGGAGRMRAPMQKKVTQLNTAKRMKVAQLSSGNTNGLSSSIIFTPVQVRRRSPLPLPAASYSCVGRLRTLRCVGRAIAG